MFLNSDNLNAALRSLVLSGYFIAQRKNNTEMHWNGVESTNTLRCLLPPSRRLCLGLCRRLVGLLNYTKTAEQISMNSPH